MKENLEMGNGFKIKRDCHRQHIGVTKLKLWGTTPSKEINMSRHGKKTF